MIPVQVGGKNLSETWFRCCRYLMGTNPGVYEYTIDKGSFEGTKRREFDFITLTIENPGERPLAPSVPLGVSPPTNDQYIEEYLAYLMTEEKQPNEQYTYGEDLALQIEEVIRRYKKDGPENNQLCMSVGGKESLWLEHSQCLRVVDTRIRYGALHFAVYFRSWDLWGGLPANLGGLQLLKKYMADQIGVGDGRIIATSKGLHLYEYAWEWARIVGGL